MANNPNLAATDKTGFETNKPASAPGNVSTVVTTNKTATGKVEGTTIDGLNNSIAHACDFVTDIVKDIGLKKFLKAIAKTIREGIRSIMRTLGFSDATGTFSTYINKAKSIAEDIKYIQKEYIEPMLDFQKYVLAYLVKIRSIITWILSLPARVLSLLSSCVTKLLTAISSAFTDALSGSDGTLSPNSSELTEAIKATKSVVSSADSLVKSTVKLAAGSAAILVSSTVGLVSPVSAADIKSADSIIKNYERTTPTIDQSSAISPTQIKSNGV